MENASKALLMAGGMLIVMLVIALVLLAWNAFSDYFSSTQDLSEISDLTEFNLQFTNYDRDDVSGYELISLANQVADYNFRHSTATGAKNNEGYTPIELQINLISQDEIKNNFTYDNNIRLFTATNYTQSDVKNQIQNIITSGTKIEALYGNVNDASKIAKSLNLLTVDYYIQQGKNEDEAEKLVVSEFNSLMGTDYDYSQVLTYIGNDSETIYQYYEYYQFKKAIFKCTSIEYNSTSGRVGSIAFDFTGEIK